MILNDGRIGSIQNNCLTIYNKDTFEVEIKKEARRTIVNFFQFKNNNLLIFFTNLIIIYKLSKQKLFLIQKIEINEFDDIKTRMVHCLSKDNKKIISPQIFELTNNSFIVKYRQEYYVRYYDSYFEELLIVLYSYDKLNKNFFLKERFLLRGLYVLKFLDTFIINTEENSFLLYDDKNKKMNQSRLKVIHEKYYFYVHCEVWKEKYLLLIKGGLLVYEYDENYNGKQIGKYIFDKKKLDLGNYIYFFNQNNPVIFFRCFGIAYAKLNDKFEIIQKETKSVIQLIGNIFDIKVTNNFIYIVGYDSICILQNK